MILDGFSAAAIARAATVIGAGELLGLPTETVYGLAADADNVAAVARIYQAKGRPPAHPLIVHVLNAASVTHYAAEVPDFARALMQAFWPGPLTLILPRRPEVAAAAAGGQNSIGLRCPSHPVAGLPDPHASGLGRCRAQRQPVWPRQPDHRTPRARRI
jgi:L-threonylcarbamoyladenylate synthase